ncbi:MAG: tyrosine--tRNA ligase [Actinobacteria bacterium]|nr:MAG: tyrosine--tRNA ligase [Actinomycetota bacterium]
MDLFDELLWRGLAYQWTGEEALPARLRAGPITLYCGFDPSAPSLHIGNLVGLTTLRRFQKAGHHPIAVAGGGTGMIGDPSGKSEERNLLSESELAENVASIRAQIARFLDFDAGASLVNNADWLGTLGYIEFLRDVGKHFSVNAMLAKESVRGRLESKAGISYTEFSYMLMQAYDFVHLHETAGCELQVGGSDQFGNISAGVDLGRRMHGAQLFGLTWPLVTRSDGVKMGKTAEGAVWLDPARTSPYAFYQWFVNVPDADAGRFLRFFTELPREEIEPLEADVARAPQKREAQRRLARELTLLVHGKDGLRAAERASEALFGGDLDGLTETELLEIFADVPSKELPRARLGAITAGEALTEAGLAKSKSEARRLIEGGGASIGNRRIDDAEQPVGPGDLASETVAVLRAGKNRFALLRFAH